MYDICVCSLWGRGRGATCVLQQSFITTAVSHIHHRWYVLTGGTTGRWQWTWPPIWWTYGPHHQQHQLVLPLTGNYTSLKVSCWPHSFSQSTGIGDYPCTPLARPIHHGPFNIKASFALGSKHSILEVIAVHLMHRSLLLRP